MPYVASPRQAVGSPDRASDLQQCLDAARRRLDETSKSSDAEKRVELLRAAVDAGWEETEVVVALDGRAGPLQLIETTPRPIGLVPSASS